MELQFHTTVLITKWSNVFICPYILWPLGLNSWQHCMLILSQSQCSISWLQRLTCMSLNRVIQRGDMCTWTGTCLHLSSMFSVNYDEEAGLYSARLPGICPYIIPDLILTSNLNAVVSNATSCIGLMSPYYLHCWANINPEIWSRD